MTFTAGRRLFRTVLFTDIVGSTELAAEVGDRKWRRVVAAHHAAIRRELRRHHGREVDTAGDGFFALFENPTDAVRCAAAAVAAVHALGLRIRAGVHTGEVEPAGGKFGGIAVHIGARLLSLAGAQEIVVSSTVRDLVAGSGHEFEDRGIQALKGVPGEWHLYAVVLPRFEEGAAVIGVDDEELHAVAMRRQRVVTVALLAVIALLVVGLGGAFLVLSKPAPPFRGPNTVAVYDANGGEPVRGIRVDRGPTALAFGDGAAWTANTDAGTVSRIDWGSGTVSSIGQAGRRPSGIALTSGRAWVVDRYSSQITILDAHQGTLLDTLEIHASAITAGENQVWLADDLGDRVVRLDPLSGRELLAVELAGPAGPTDLVVAGGSLWVAAPRAGTLFRVDSASATVIEAGIGLEDIRAVSRFSDDVWVASPNQDKIARIDAGSGRVAVSVDVCDAPVALAANASGVWVACATERALWRVDRAGSVVTRIALDGVPTALVADGDGALVALRAD